MIALVISGLIGDETIIERNLSYSYDYHDAVSNLVVIIQRFAKVMALAT